MFKFMIDIWYDTCEIIYRLLKFIDWFFFEFKVIEKIYNNKHSITACKLLIIITLYLILTM